MEFYEESQTQQRGIERLGVLIYSLFVINIVGRALSGDWPVWIPLLMVICIGSIWTIFLQQYYNYMMRTLVMAIVINFSVLLYGLHTNDLFGWMTSFFVMSVAIALFGVAEYIYINLLIALVMYCSYAIRMGGGFFEDEEFVSFLFRFINVIVFELLLLCWTKNRAKDVQQSMKTIEALKLAERSKDDFLANVSHEIRTPLNTISGMSELILSGDDMEQIHEQANHIQVASKNLMSTVNDILCFSELQAGEITLEEETYQLSTMMNDIMNTASALRKDKSIEVLVNFDPNLPRVLYGDEKKIRRVVMNLINNAIKFTKEGGICITFKGRKENYGLNLTITIEDTGIGMNAENVEKLYTGYGQLDTRRNRKNGGIGLGLEISRALVEKMGGTIIINSEYGKGSTIQVVIPQKIIEEKPVVTVEQKEQMKALLYFNMEQIKMREIRDLYTGNMLDMVEGLGISSHICRSLSELKRRMSKDTYTHIIISDVEYREDMAYFDSVSEQIRLVVMLEQNEDNNITNQNVYRLYKPFHVMALADIFNQVSGTSTSNLEQKAKKFVAPDAKIMVVDDNYMNILVMKGLLSKYQIQMEYALSGAEALEKLESMDYDFVFMDHMMPEMDGVETAHRIRNKIGSYYQQLPIIALTANAIAGTREMFLREGFADYVEKPVEESVLERVLIRNLPKNKIIHDMDTEVMKKPANKEISFVAKEVDEERGMMQIKELDTAIGELYCGGEEGYKMILLEFCESAVESREELQQLYDAQDWENYTIKVHGLKSSMKTIGNKQISDAALELEMAGKNGQIELILEKHDALMHMHFMLFKNLMAYPELADHLSKEIIEANMTENRISETKKEVEQDETLDEMDRKEFEQLIEVFETAVYSLDRETLEQVITKLEGHQYHGHSLTPELNKIIKKIEQEDYFSAYELLAATFARLDE